MEDLEQVTTNRTTNGSGPFFEVLRFLLAQEPTRLAWRQPVEFSFVESRDGTIELWAKTTKAREAGEARRACAAEAARPEPLGDATHSRRRGPVDVGGSPGRNPPRP